MAKLNIDKRAKDLLREIESMPDEANLNCEDTATLLGVSTAWLAAGRLKANDFGPPFRVLSPRLVRYNVGEVRRWLRNRPNRPGGQLRRRLKKHYELANGVSA